MASKKKRIKRAAKHPHKSIRSELPVITRAKRRAAQAVSKAKKAGKVLKSSRGSATKHLWILNVHKSGNVLTAVGYGTRTQAHEKAKRLAHRHGVSKVEVLRTEK